MPEQQDPAGEKVPGTKMQWPDSDGERSVSLFRVKTGGIMLIFERCGKLTHLSLSDTAAFVTLKLLLDWFDEKTEEQDQVIVPHTEG